MHDKIISVCQRKLALNTLQEAQKFADSVRLKNERSKIKDPTAFRTRPYRCKQCGKWHVER